jgi:hypothetical protein
LRGRQLATVLGRLTRVAQIAPAVAGGPAAVERLETDGPDCEPDVPEEAEQERESWREKRAREMAWRNKPRDERERLVLEALRDDSLTITELLERMRAELSEFDLYESKVRPLVTGLVKAGELDRRPDPRWKGRLHLSGGAGRSSLSPWIVSRPGNARHQPTFAQIERSGMIWPQVWPPRLATAGLDVPPMVREWAEACQRGPSMHYIERRPPD